MFALRDLRTMILSASMLGLVTITGCAGHLTRAAPTGGVSPLTELPKAIAHVLETRGCTIPEVREPGLPPATNIIRGEFARTGQFDGAVLCSRHGRSTILV